MNDKKTYTTIIESLEKVYGKPSSTGFGSAVFYEVSKKDIGLATIALEDCKLFMGENGTLKPNLPG